MLSRHHLRPAGAELGRVDVRDLELAQVFVSPPEPVDAQRKKSVLHISSIAGIPSICKAVQKFMPNVLPQFIGMAALAGPTVCLDALEDDLLCRLTIGLPKVMLFLSCQEAGLLGCVGHQTPNEPAISNNNQAPNTTP